jgi:hypothetical protein
MLLKKSLMRNSNGVLNKQMKDYAIDEQKANIP